MTPFDAMVRCAQRTFVAPTLCSFFVRKYFAWTLIAWLEGTAFYALAGAGAAAAPPVAVLRAQLAGLLATMIPVPGSDRRAAGHDDPGSGLRSPGCWSR